jgi:hypothetical protein
MLWIIRWIGSGFTDDGKLSYSLKLLIQIKIFNVAVGFSMMSAVNIAGFRQISTQENFGIRFWTLGGCQQMGLIAYDPVNNPVGLRKINDRQVGVQLFHYIDPDR